MANWKSLYVLGSNRQPISGSSTALRAAIRNGADLRVYTEFRHNEHIDPTSTSAETVQELGDFRVTYLIEDAWVAGIINLRQPISLPNGFGPRNSMSFFLYNQDGSQALARPHLDADPVAARQPEDFSGFLRYHLLEESDQDTFSPSKRFVYDFDIFRFIVCDDWREVLSHREDGTVLSGSVEALANEVAHGCYVKVAVQSLCNDFCADNENASAHEVFVECGSCYYYTERKLFIAGSHPVVRVKPAIPLRYSTAGWDFGWLMIRSDGLVARRLVNPYSLKFFDSEAHCAARWFVR